MTRTVIYQLASPIQNYAWGSHDAIATLQRRASPTVLPEAELWMGAHPSASSTVAGPNGELSLTALIEAAPCEFLGENTAQRFEGQLPFLFKVLGVAEPLSIQVHPSAAQARAGFADEEARKVPRSAPNRNYRDSNHKPELVCALTDFHALCGFRDVAELRALAQCGLPPEIVDSLAPVLQGGSDSALHAVLEDWLRLPRSECRRLLSALRPCARQIARGDTDLAAGFAWIVRLLEMYDDDPGVLAALLLRHLHLHSGEALFVAAGVLHAYLDGTAVEVMASSDNVIRGGLTPKHVDVDGLLHILGPNDGHGESILPRQVGVERIYDAPAREFRLSRLDVDGSPARLVTASAEILLCTEGALALSSSDNAVQLARGTAAFVSASAREYSVSGHGVGYRVVVPVLA